MRVEVLHEILRGIKLFNLIYILLKKKTKLLLQQKSNETSSTSATPIQSRRSRVMHIEDKSKAFRQVVRKDQLAKLQEVRKAPEQWSAQNNGRKRLLNPPRRNLELKSKLSKLIAGVHKLFRSICDFVEKRFTS